MALALILLIAGVALLYFGGEVLVANAVRLARFFGLSSLVIGLTVVAFATSAPELFASLVALREGSPGIAVGNVLGSNIANIALILGVAALVRPLAGKAQFLVREIPMLTAVSITPFLALWDGVIVWWEGAVLFVALLVYIGFLLRSKEAPGVVDQFEEEYSGEEEEAAGPQRSVWFSLGGVVLGLGLLVLGADLMVDGAVTIARALGVSERVIGLTMVAFGTSLPELASSMVAARRREGDIVLGNVVGSNIFNVLCVLGLTSIFYPIPLPLESVLGDLWVGLALSVAMVPLLLVGRRLYLGRWEGVLLVVTYLVYVVVLFIQG